MDRPLVQSIHSLRLREYTIPHGPLARGGSQKLALLRTWRGSHEIFRRQIADRWFAGVAATGHVGGVGEGCDMVITEYGVDLVCCTVAMPPPQPTGVLPRRTWASGLVGPGGDTLLRIGTGVRGGGVDWIAEVVHNNGCSIPETADTITVQRSPEVDR